MAFWPDPVLLVLVHLRQMGVGQCEAAYGSVSHSAQSYKDTAAGNLLLQKSSSAKRAEAQSCCDFSCTIQHPFLFLVLILLQKRAAARSAQKYSRAGILVT